MRSAIGFAMILIGLAGCGGGTSRNTVDSSNNTIPINTFDLIQYQPGDSLSYDYKYNSDGYEAIDIRGKLILNILSSPYTSSIVAIPIKLVTSLEVNGSIQSSSIDYYGYDLSGGLRKFVLENMWYSNQENNDEGSLFIASPIETGASWASATIKEVDAIFMNVSTDYSVIGKEIVRDIESYKIIYSGTGAEITCEYCIGQTLRFSGVMWVNPSIGIIKIEENGTYHQSLYDKKYYESWVLSEISISSYNNIGLD